MSDAPPGARVELVPVTRDIAEALLSGRASGLALVAGYPHADTGDALRAFLAAGDEAAGTFLIRRRSDGLVVGDCGASGGVDADGALEIGYGLAPSARGHGIATDAVRLLLDWARAQPGVAVAEAEVELGNAPSRALLERLGFEVRSVDAQHVRYARSL